MLRRNVAFACACFLVTVAGCDPQPAAIEGTGGVGAGSDRASGGTGNAGSTATGGTAPLVGGLTELTAAQESQISDKACAGEIHNMTQAGASAPDAASDCIFPIPPPPPDGRAIDTLQVVATTTANGTPKLLLIGLSESGCSHGDGWYFDGSVAQTKVRLCTQTCAHLRTDPSAQITIYATCKVPSLL
jgi:hypothetical protein